jgi:hypothetical protein
MASCDVFDVSARVLDDVVRSQDRRPFLLANKVLSFSSYKIMVRSSSAKHACI